ncbi:MAG: NADH-quinone oxidoreductase subunit J [Mycobacteriales bacterium]
MGNTLSLAAGHTGATMGHGETLIFWILGPISVIGALGMVVSRNAVHAALWLVTTMFSLGVFYVMERGPFIGFVQIIVYTGAIMILFLFVLMLIGRDSSDSLVETLKGQRVAAVLLGGGLAVLLIAFIASALDKQRAVGLQQASADGNLPGISRLLFHDYVFAFELTSALLITAAVGAMVLANVERGRRSQREVYDERLAGGDYLGPKPGPGVFAHGDAVTRHALLPDGSEAPTSVIRSAEVAGKEQEAVRALERRRGE